MLDDRLARLLCRKMSGDATAAELQELEQWLRANASDQYFSEILATYWTTPHDSNASSHSNADQHFAHILEMADGEEKELDPALEINSGRSRRLLTKIAVAATLIIAAGIIAWTFNRTPAKISSEPGGTVTKEITAVKGERLTKFLPDGTRVRLNSDSKLIYDNSFNDTIRAVTLEGEAFFDVVKDQKRPFIVRTSGIDIRVLGTAFNVKSYPLEPTIEATLIHGLIEVIDRNHPEIPASQLLPHAKMIYDKTKNVFLTNDKHQPAPATLKHEAIQGSIAIPLPNDVSDTALIETSWVYDRLKFDEIPFTEIAVKMERWYDVEIEFQNEKVAKAVLHGSFQNETIDQALEFLKLIQPFRYTKQGNKIMIYSR